MVKIVQKPRRDQREGGRVERKATYSIPLQRSRYRISTSRLLLPLDQPSHGIPGSLFWPGSIGHVAPYWRSFSDSTIEWRTPDWRIALFYDVGTEKVADGTGGP